MAFIFNFDSSKSQFNFKDKLTYDKANMFLKQSSLINYSLVDTLKTYYNIFDIDSNNLIEINKETDDAKIKKFLENTLLNMMYKKLFDDKIIQDVYITIDGANDIKFNVVKPQLDKLNPYTTYVYYIHTGEEFISTYDDTYGVEINHRKNFNNSFNLGLDNDISYDELWGKTIKIPYVETNNGHITRGQDIEFLIPNPQDMNKLYEEDITPGTSFYIPHINFTSDYGIERKDLIFHFSFKRGNQSFCISKILNNYVINNYYNDSSKTKYLFFECGFCYPNSGYSTYFEVYPFSIYYNSSEDKLYIELLQKFKNKNLDYRDLSNARISVYSISYN